ncbi:PepSY-associated TM helix domain-containing protein [Caballeronia sordidicola]|uniref:PepSY-associated TM helix domain-containing protein n=1 Tax=Caballeronia sordidicola TaxID=196367 RepID=A0A158FVC0_CABSO|nr:PepSY-associated TM helix domain-containing protein [Caballeronia sordidicola]SAL23637.1 PepSY-associated TM helix domain-containing protein [Caballeronia sordidicola]
MRAWLVRLHRWLGVGTALFLFMAGLTGAIIAWDHELDAALNPGFYNARTASDALPPLVLADRLEAAEPRLQVTYLPLGIESGHTLQAGVTPREDPSRRPFDLGFNQVALDPGTGAVQGRREWGALSLGRLELIPFIYKLHYTLHLPMRGGIDLGVWVMGLVGIAWLLDSMVAIVLAFPNPRSWRKSLAFRFRRGGYALTFDLHRSGGVWLWALLMVIAITSVSMNLGDPVVRPIVSMFSPLAPSPFAAQGAGSQPSVAAPDLSRERIVALANAAARRAHIAAPPGGLFYLPALHVYVVGFFRPGGDHGDAGLGNAWLYFNARSGAQVGAQIPGRGSAGDIFMQAQFPLHSGRIIGLTGRIMVTLLGLAVAILSATGLLIWLKKSRARRALPARRRVRGAA